MPAPDSPLTIIVDTREQAPYAFERFQAESVRAGLPTGDYSLPGHERHAAIERKSLDDLIGCLAVGRDRFERELARGRSMDLFAVVVEASMEDVARHRYTSRMDPHAALQSILAFQVRYACPFVFAGSRAGGEYITYWTLQKYVREVEARQAETQAVAELVGLENRRATRHRGQP
ncbi:MAG: ERCC4 domain-containing [Desulfovibrionaceae bacterium]|nr:MAG: ERCC4 domain-containing [Desulfovibrionaceae bacterium]